MSSSRATRSRSHRRWVVIAGCLAAATLVAMVPVIWRRIDEERRLVQLDSPRPEERAAAARRLGELRSVRAVPRLVEIAISEEPEQFRAWDWRNSVVARALIDIGRPAAAPLLEQIKRNRWEGKWTWEGRAHTILVELGRAAVGPLIDAASSPDDGFRAYAVGRLGDFVGTDPGAFERVALALGDGAEAVRMAAVDGLGVAVNNHPRAFDCVARALADEAPAVRLAAVQSLGEATSRSEEAAGLLRARLEDPAEDPGIRRITAHAMPDLGVAGARTLRSALTHADPLVRVYAGIRLMLPDPPWEREALPVLLASLRGEHDEARLVALSELSGTPHLSVEDIADFLKDSSGEVRWAAAEALARRRRAPEGSFQDLLRILRERPANDCISAIILLGELGPAAHEAVPALVQVVVAGGEEAQYAALQTLLRIESVPTSLVPVLIRALAVGLTCDEASAALGRIGPDAAAAIPALIAAFGTDGCSGDVIVEALGRIGAPTVPALLAVLKGESAEHRFWALRALSAIGPLAREAAAPLMDIARTPEQDLDIVWLAARALGRIGPEAREAMPLLVDLLGVEYYDSDEEGTALVPEALGRLGPAARSAVPALLQTASSNHDDMRAAALLALGRLQGDGEAVLMAVRRGLTDDHPLVRACAALALTHLHADRDEPGKTLDAAFKDPEFRWLPFLNAIAGYPDELKAALPTLVAAIERGEYSWDEITKACDLIGTLGADAGPAAPVLERLIDRLRESEASEQPRGLYGCGRDRAAAEGALRRIRQPSAR